MRELVRELFFLFSVETGILGVVKENEKFIISILMGIAVLICFFGFKIYRGLFSALMFMGSTLVIVFFMRGHSDWGTITTVFAVLGTVLAFFSYRWNVLGGYCISISSGVTIAWVYTHSILITIITGILVAVSMRFLPVITLCFMTTIWGVVVIQEFIIFGDKVILISSIILIVGFSLQLLTNRNQTLFDKPYPDKMKQWMEKKRESSS